MKIFFLIIFVFAVGEARSEEFPGGPNLTDEFSKGFADDKGMLETDKQKVEANRMSIGGSLQAEWDLFTLNNPAREDILLSPMTLELYIDSQLKNDVRAFFKGRLIHDASVDESLPNPLTGQAQKQNSNALDELNLRLHMNHKIFWTLGVQKIKWGAAKFWNPTDFINLQKRDFLRQEDLRSGISMLKAHVPWGNSNFYLIAVNEGASESRQVGSAARIEIPFSTAEWTLSSYARRGQTTKLGSDLSFALWDFDVYIEAAQSDIGKDKNISGGLTYEFKYSDDDTMALGLEAFWQENGTEDKTSYFSNVVAGKYVPFYLGKAYTLASVILMKPGSWNDSNFLFYAIQNNSDLSQYFRFTWIYTGISDVSWTVALGSRSGASDSEMRFLGQDLDALVQMKVFF